MIGQLFAFGTVGALAAATHLLIVFALVERHMHPLAANVVAFVVAFQISYFGHRYWTFHGSRARHRVAVSRFLLTAVASFAMNEGMFYLLLNYTTLPYLLSLTVVLVCVTPATFLLSKLWAFR